MALTLGTNCGFVSTAPSADPTDTNAVIDDRSWAIKHTSPATAGRITQVGWWCDTASQEANFELGLYSDAGAGEPEARLEVSATNAKGTGAGWKTATVAWNISPSTVYWIAAQLDNVATATSTNIAGSGGGGSSVKLSQSALPADWGAGDTNDADNMVAIYAVWAVSTSSPHGSQFYHGASVAGLEKLVRDSNDFCEKYDAA